MSKRPTWGKDVKRILLALGQIFLAGTIAVTVIAAVLSWLYAVPFFGILTLGYFFGGLVLLGVSALIGSGFSEYGYYGSYLTVASPHYVRTISEDRPRRRAEQFEFMVLGVLFSAGLIAMAWLVSSFPYLAVVVPLALASMVLVLQRVMRVRGSARAEKS